MYTQCPDCHAAFRVTAEVLKQAAGKVRCGSCSHAFNALEFLSETRPARVVADDAEAPIPELQPDADSVQPGTPKPASAKQSAALLKTLEQLAGSDVRIEDTGVEWRVLDLDDDDDFPGSEFFETSRTPVDEFLTATPTSVDAGEIFDEAMTALGETAIDELRFDDDTPLPDDLDENGSPLESGPLQDATGDGEATPPDFETATNSEVGDEQGDWADLLDEFADDAGPTVPPLDAELAAIEEEERRRDAASSDEERGDEDTAAATDEDGDAAPTEDTASSANDDEADGSDTRNQPLDDENGDADDEDKDENEDEIEDKKQDQGENRDEDQDDTRDENEGENEDENDDQDSSDTNDAEREPAVASGAGEKLITETDISPGFESIVMEGEFVSSALDNDKRAADIAAAAALAEQAQHSKDDEQAERAFGRPPGVLTAIAVLAALLLVQGLHQSRQQLLTVPALDRLVGPVYRAIGRPVSPAWDVTGWRFETTTGNAGETDGALTINSRIGNASDAALPYPLIRITLTNRYEEPLGSSLLTPAAYLGESLDPGARVQPGGSFDAVISVLSPSDAATGFKLNVCYRLSDTELRCAAGGFK